jgi:hypothetical protein
VSTLLERAAQVIHERPSQTEETVWREPEVRRRQRRVVLQHRSKGELVDIILRLEARLQRLDGGRYSMETTVIAPSEAFGPNLAPLTFENYDRAEDYWRLTLPLVTKPTWPSGERPEMLWRLILISSNAAHRPIGLEVLDDVSVGRKGLDSDPDLDLSGYQADALGVSRQHALLRPSRYSLFLIDLGSRNGTFCNGVRVGPGRAHRLAEGDILSFGRLHFKLRFLTGPTNLVN